MKKIESNWEIYFLLGEIYNWPRAERSFKPLLQGAESSFIINIKKKQYIHAIHTSIYHRGSNYSQKG